MRRRSILGGLIGLGIAAPAIVRASSLMPLYVPRQSIALPPPPLLGIESFTLESWVNLKDGKWHAVNLTRSHGRVSAWVDGKHVSPQHAAVNAMRAALGSRESMKSSLRAHVDDLRLYRIE